MCGINGIVKFNQALVSNREIEAMNEKILYRGPDDQGVFIDKNIGFGHVRLSIVDLSSRGHQPMEYSHNNRKAVITFNGEIYNFPEIRQELAKMGYKFSSGTDTEVVLAAYLEYGFGCLEKFNGMFAFVIYDLDKKILFGARDRFGKKPFKYYFDDKQFIFSSELKAILENNIKREIDYNAINDYLTLQYVPSPETGFQNIKKLPHAHYFVLSLETKVFEIKRYFDLDFSKKLDLPPDAWHGLIEKELDEAVKRRLIADVPLGAFLSGGVDSSAIVAFMSKHKARPKTFSISFDDKEFDESIYARQVAKLYNCDHTEFRVRPNDLLDNIEDLIYHYEEPYADVSQLPTYILSKFTRKYVTVALSGDAGDENFGGYDQYRRHAFVEKYRAMISLADPSLPALSWASRRMANDFLDKMVIFLKSMEYSFARRHYNFTTYFDEFTKKDFYKDEFVKNLADNGNCFEKILYNKNFCNLDKAYYLDFNTYIPDDINVKVDLASMYSALEVRAPLLDYKFVELTAKIPWQYKSNISQGKIIFKKMLEKYLPKEILYRRKHGFGVPIKHWFRNELKDYSQNIVLDSKGLVLQIFKKEKVEQLYEDHLRGRDNSKKIWSLLALNVWFNKYFN